jgi:hypothetical protein
MNKYDTYHRVYRCLLFSSFLAYHTDEGALVLAIICQAIQDAMGLYDADKERVYISGSRRSRGKRKFITRQNEAQEWFRDKKHYVYCDAIRLDRELVDRLLKTKCGVEL